MKGLILEKIQRIICEETGLAETEVKLETPLNSLVVDSLERVSLLTAVQNAFNVDVPDDDLRNIVTVKDVVEYLEAA